MGPKGQRSAGAVDPRAPFDDRYQGWMVSIAGHQFVGAGRSDHHRAAWRGDAVQIACRQHAHAQEQHPLRFGRLQIVIINDVEIELGGLVEREMAAANIDRGGRVGLGPDRVAGGDGIVGGRVLPFDLLGTVEGHATEQPRDAADPRRRIDLGCSTLGYREFVAQRAGRECASQSEGGDEGRANWIADVHE